MCGFLIPSFGAKFIPMKIKLQDTKSWLRQQLQGDYQLWCIIFILVIYSVLAVYSSMSREAYMKTRPSEFYLLKHMTVLSLSMFVMWRVHLMDYFVFAKYARAFLWLSFLLLLYAHFFGQNINDANRMIRLPIIGQTFQPSDLAKIALIASLSSMLTKRQNMEYEPRIMMPMIFWCGTICAAIALDNFSTAAMLGLTCFLLMFIGRVPTKYLGMLIVVCVVLGGIALKIGRRWDTFWNRIDVFLKGSNPPFQAKQAYIAIVNGDWFGMGPGQSSQRNFLPFPFADYIYATIIEEYGLLFGALPIVLLYLWLLYRGMKVVAGSQHAFGGLLAAGLTFSIVIQAFIHMAVNVGLVPVTGQTLPFVSWGGTSIVAMGLAVGIIIGVSRDAQRKEI